MLIKTVEDFRQALETSGYAFPGGYPLYFSCSDGEALSFEAAKENAAEVEAAIRDGDSSSGWHVWAYDVNWEDPNLFCAHTNKRIESAYAEDD